MSYCPRAESRLRVPRTLSTCLGLHNSGASGHAKCAVEIVLLVTWRPSALAADWRWSERAVDGVGVLAEDGVLPGHRYWIDWLRQTPVGSLEPDDHHITDPEREGFYDYASRDFMEYPRRNNQPWVEGPHVDHGGVDDYLLTVSVPITHSGRFLGVAAADLLVADLEQNVCSLARSNGQALRTA